MTLASLQKLHLHMNELFPHKYNLDVLCVENAHIASVLQKSQIPQLGLAR